MVYWKHLEYLMDREYIKCLNDWGHMEYQIDRHWEYLTDGRNLKDREYRKWLDKRRHLEYLYNVCAFCMPY